MTARTWPVARTGVLPARRTRRPGRPLLIRTGRRSGLVAVLSVLLAIVVGTAAWAYWSTAGSGTGSAITSTLSAPTNTQVSSVTGSGKVDVTWTAPTSGAAPQGYYVQRTISGGSPAFACATSATSLLSGTSCSDSPSDGSYTYTVTAVKGSWTAKSSASQAVTVTSKIGTSTTIVSSTSPSVVGQTVTYTATVTQASGTTKPTGTVSFTDNGSAISPACSNATLSNGTTTCQVTYNSPGNHPVTASYGGAAGFATSASSALSQTVNKAPTTTTITSSSNPSRTGEQVTYTATVALPSPGSATPIGTVSFSDVGNTISGCAARPLAASAPYTATCVTSYSSPAANHSVTASYTGDANTALSTSSGVNQSTVKADTLTTVSSLTSPAVVGQQVTLKAVVSVSSPGIGTASGSVTFTDGTNALCTATLTSGSGTCTTSFGSAGTRTVTGSYGGDAAVNASSSTTSQTVTAPVAVAVTSMSADSGTSATDRLTNVSNQSLTGTAGAGATVTVSRGSQTVSTTAAANGSWTSPSLPLAEGSNTLTITATDPGSNVSSTSYGITLDTAAPGLSVTAPAADGASMSSNTYKGECSTNFSVCGAMTDTNGVASVTVSMVKNPTGSPTPQTGTLVTVPSTLPTGIATVNGTWNFSTGNLNNASYRFTVTVTDLAGNVTVVTRTFTIS